MRYISPSRSWPRMRSVGSASSPRVYGATECVSEPVNRDRLQARVAEHNLVVAARGRVALVGGPHVLLKHQPQVGQAAQEADRLLLGHRLVIDVRRLAGELVPQGPGDLLRELV